MNPAFMSVQAVWLALACVLLGLTPAHVEAFVLAVLLALWWLVWSVSYCAALAGQRRSDQRRALDRRVRWQSVAVVAVGLGAALAGAHLGELWRERELLTICAGAFAALAWVVYASSLVDWYYVRPRVDGIVREPPCRSSGEQVWGNVTRIWYLNRGLAEFLGVVGVIVVLSSLAGGLIAGGGTLPTAAIVAIPTGAGTALVLLTQAAIATLRHQVATEPSIWIGDELRDGDWRAYVLQVTIRGVVVREWDPESGIWERERELTHSRLDEGRMRRRRFAGCEGCSGLNPRCERAALAAEQAVSA